MWFSPRSRMPEKSLTKRLRDDYWFWESILGNLSARFARHQTDGPLIIDVLGSILLQANSDERRLLKSWDNGGWASDLESDFASSLKEIRRWEVRLVPYLTKSQSKEEWKAFAESVWDFIRESGLATLLVMELLSNRSDGEAWEKLARVLEEWTESEKLDDPMVEDLIGLDEEPEDPEEREQVAAERAREWQSFAEAKGNLREQMAFLMLSEAALVKAMELEHIRERLNEDSELLVMIENAMEEYRNISQVTDRTYDIYDLHFTEETGRRLDPNEYQILLSAMLLHGNDHLYGSYHDAIAPWRKLCSVLLRQDPDHPERFLDAMETRIAAHYSALDFAHPMAPVFYLRSIGHTMSRVLEAEDILTFAAEEADLAKELAEMVREAKLENEKDRLVQGDFSGEHLYQQGENAFQNIQSGIEFEQFLQYIFTRLGYDAQATKASGDQGADLILRKNGTVLVVQAKFYDRPVGNKAVQEAAAALRFYNGNRAMVVTNSTYTNSARELAKKNDVMLIDKDQLQELIRLAYTSRAGEYSF